MEKLNWMCAEPECERPKVGGLDVCMSHKQAQSKQERIDSAPVKPSTPLRRTGPPKKQSDKRAGENVEYAKRRDKWLKGKVCVMCDWEGKKNTDIQLHHQQGRNGALLTDETKWLPLCPKHHNWATEHSKEAIELGISLPRNSTTI